MNIIQFIIDNWVIVTQYYFSVSVVWLAISFFISGLLREEKIDIIKEFGMSLIWFLLAVQLIGLLTIISLEYLKSKLQGNNTPDE